jgi:hypothetical protein
MRFLACLILGSTLLLGCGSSEDDNGGKTGTGGTDAGTGGATGGSGGSTGGSGGSGGSTGGSGGSTGGAAGSTGGSAGSTGGTAGSGSGGTAGSGGSAGSSAAAPECTTDTDCKLVDDCCTCESMPNAQNPPTCSQTCLISTCTSLGVPNKDVSCVAGRCVAGFTCEGNVLCPTTPPTCAPGTVPLIAAGCWQGSCVPADECLSVASCAACTGDLACAIWQAQLGPQEHCVTVPASCNGDFSCACMGPSVCTPPFDSCNDLSGQKGVTCGCPVC